MSEVKRYVFGISRTEPGDRLTAGTVYVDEADYAALESKLAAVQAGAEKAVTEGKAWRELAEATQTYWDAAEAFLGTAPILSNPAELATKYKAAKSRWKTASAVVTDLSKAAYQASKEKP